LPLNCAATRVDMAFVCRSGLDALVVPAFEFPLIFVDESGLSGS
jgi:hypothetical protein